MGLGTIVPSLALIFVVATLAKGEQLAIKRSKLVANTNIEKRRGSFYHIKVFAV